MQDLDAANSVTLPITGARASRTKPRTLSLRQVLCNEAEANFILAEESSESVITALTKDSPSEYADYLEFERDAAIVVVLFRPMGI